MVWVKGNDLTTIYKVTAIDQRTKQPLDNFDLFECSSIEVAYAVNASKKSVTEYDVIDTDKISIKWEGDKQRLGQYSVEIKGVWNGINWRMYNYKNYTFTIVDSNEAANIPPENFIADGSYLMDVEIGFLFGAQADWEQTDATKGDYIKHKPTSLSDFSEDSTHRTVTDSEKAAWNAKYSKPSGGIPKSDLSSSVQTSLGKADTALQNETDPTVPAWAKQPTKPSYTASEVGALPDTTPIPDELKDLSDDATHRLVTDTEKSTWNGKQDALVSGTNIKTVNNQSLLGSGNITIQGGGGSGAIDSISVNGTPQTIDENKNVDITMPTKVSDLDNDSGFITGYTETDPTVPSWAKASSKPSYTASEVGAVPTTRTVNGKALSADITLSASDVNALPSSTVIPDAQIQSDWNQADNTKKDYIKNKPTIPAAGIPSGGNAGQVLTKTDGSTDYAVAWRDTNNIFPSAYCTTAAATAAKGASCTFWTATANSYLHFLLKNANTNQGALSLNVNNTGAKPIYINGTASGSSNYTLPAGSYLVFYDGTNYYFRTDGKLTANITGAADGSANVIETVKVNGTALAPDANKAVDVSVPTVIDSLSSSSTTAALSANQGKVLNDTKQPLIDSAHKLSYSLLDGTPTIPTALSDLSDDSTHRVVTDTQIDAWNAKASKVALVAHGTDDTTYTLPPHQYHTWGTISSLTISLGTAESGVVNEYWFKFESGSTATNLVLPASVVFPKGNALTVAANCIYEVHIVENRAEWNEWEVQS